MLILGGGAYFKLADRRGAYSRGALIRGFTVVQLTQPGYFCKPTFATTVPRLKFEFFLKCNTLPFM